ncbi:MAG TPA: SoxR reducing system RseC family protein [Steroidobacteraceae bacterium]|nr:SoxR reducing system RseC family protein [Steroidobacteraceae bacterium]
MRPDAEGRRTTEAVEPLEQIERAGRVVRADESSVWVACEPTAGCAACAAGVGCRGGLIAALLGRPRLIEVERGTSPARPGELVRVRIPVVAVSRAAALAYGAPLAGLLIGTLLAAWGLPGSGDGAAVAGAIAGCAAGVWIAQRRLARDREARDLRPTLVNGDC